MSAPSRPEPGEYAPYYAKYVALVPDGELIPLLTRQGEETAALLESLPEAQGDFAYQPGKWTIKELVCHVADTERVFAYRALRFARGDPTPLPGFDEKIFAPNSGAAARTLADLIAELRVVRAATLALLCHLPPEAWLRRGVASGAEVTVRALAWMIAGHERHHRLVLQDRYLAALR